MRTRLRILILLLTALVAAPNSASACGFCSPFHWLFGCGLHHGHYRGDGGYSTWRVIDDWLGYGYLRNNQGVYGHYPGNWYRNLPHHPTQGPGVTQNWMPQASVYTPSWNAAPAWGGSPILPGWGMAGGYGMYGMYGGWSECSECDSCGSDSMITPMESSSDCSCSGGTSEFLPPTVPPTDMTMFYQQQAMLPQLMSGGFPSPGMTPQAGPWQPVGAGWQPQTAWQPMPRQPFPQQPAPWNPGTPWNPAAGSVPQQQAQLAMKPDLLSGATGGPAVPTHGAASGIIHTAHLVPGPGSGFAAPQPQLAAQQPGQNPWSPRTAWSPDPRMAAYPPAMPQQPMMAAFPPANQGWNAAFQPAPSVTAWGQPMPAVSAAPGFAAPAPQPASQWAAGNVPTSTISATRSAMLIRYPSALQ